MATRSGTMPHTGTSSSDHQTMVASRSFVPNRAEQITTPAGTLRGVMLSVARTRFGSTPPARVGMTTASARPSAACTTLPSPGGVSTTTRASSWLMAFVTVRTLGPSIRSTPSRGSASNHSAVEPWGSASTRTTWAWRPRSDAAAARYTDVVVLPTPPLTLLTTMFTGRPLLFDPSLLAAPSLAPPLLAARALRYRALPRRHGRSSRPSLRRVTRTPATTMTTR